MKGKKGNAGWIALIIIILLVIGAVYVFSNSATKENVCGTHTETYTESAKGCDALANCECIHQGGVFGLGACDSCSCTREVSNC